MSVLKGVGFHCVRALCMTPLAGLALSQPAPSAETTAPFAPQIHAVNCGGKVCGSMEISWYRKFQDGDTSPRLERNGVSIRGRFRSSRDQPREYHYLQVLTEFKADDFRWSRDPDALLPAGFVDVPPFGVRRPETDANGRFRIAEHRFDALPWFDDGEFPLFDDRPRAFLASARVYGRVTMRFETWLICVIAAEQGPDRERVSDDFYVVAPLTGWTWGYDIKHEDVGVLTVDELEDYAFSQMPLSFLAQPTSAFKHSLGATLGRTVTDRFNIRLADAAGCRDRLR